LGPDVRSKKLAGDGVARDLRSGGRTSADVFASNRCCSGERAIQFIRPQRKQWNLVRKPDQTCPNRLLICRVSAADHSYPAIVLWRPAVSSL